jgi:hypothetical protein
MRHREVMIPQAVKVLDRFGEFYLRGFPPWFLGSRRAINEHE